jgi:hypothetical protein
VIISSARAALFEDSALNLGGIGALVRCILAFRAHCRVLTLKSQADLSKKSAEPTWFNNVLTLKEITDRVLKHKGSNFNIDPFNEYVRFPSEGF